MLCSTYARKMEHCNSETDLERDASKIGTISVRGRNNDENKAKCQNQFDANSLHKSVTIGNFCHSKISMKRPRSRPKIMMNNFYLILPRRRYFTLYKTKLARQLHGSIGQSLGFLHLNGILSYRRLVWGICLVTRKISNLFEMA